MPKPMNIYTIILAVIVIIAAAYFVFTKKCITYLDPATNTKTGGCYYIWQKGWWKAPQTKNTSYRILELRDFSCPGMTGFNFQYPVFAGWEPMEGGGEGDKLPEAPLQSEFECIILLQSPKEYVVPTGSIAPQIKVTKDQPHVATKKNPHKVPYEALGADDYFFNLASFSIEIKLIGVSERHGFAKDVFWKQVMESFRAR